MAGNNFTNQWNNQALQAKRLENVFGWDYNTQTQNIIATDITVPFDVNFNTPKYGNQFCGGIRIGQTDADGLFPLQVVLAGSSSPSTFLVKTGDFLDVQATSILSNSDTIAENITNIVVYMGQAAEQPFEPFYNNLFQPYYNFDVVADWKTVTGVGGNLTQTDFANWLQGSLSFFAPSFLEGYTYEPIIEDSGNGVYVGRVKCRLLINCNGNSWFLNNNFFEINGLGDFTNCAAIYIQDNTQVIDYPQLNVFLRGLKEINFKYYSQYNSGVTQINFGNNSYVENIDLSFLQYNNSLTNFTCNNMPLVSEFSNFILFPNTLTDFTSTEMKGFKRFEYDLTNCTNLQTFQFYNTSNYTPDGLQRLGLEYINTSLLPDSISTLILVNNNIKQMTAGYTKFPASLQTIYLQQNNMVEFNPDCQLPNSLQNLVLVQNLLYEFDLKYPLPTGLFQLGLSDNLIQRFNTQCNSSLLYIGLQQNQLTDMSFSHLLNSNLQYLVLNNNALNSYLPTIELPSLGALYLNNNFITSFIPKGTAGPSQIVLNDNLMTTAAWDDTDANWATLLVAGSGKAFVATNNTNSITTSPLNATLVAKGYSVTP